MGIHRSWGCLAKALCVIFQEGLLDGINAKVKVTVNDTVKDRDEDRDNDLDASRQIDDGTGVSLIGSRVVIARS
jgi:hypothetical protein